MVGNVILNNKPVKFTKTTDTKKSADFSATEDSSLGLAPPLQKDERLQSMEILIDKKLRGPLSVQDYHQKFWKNDTFYSTWLQSSGKTNVQVGKWQIMSNDQNDENSDGNGAIIINPWDGETYNCQRVVTFQFKRTTHLYTGNAIANVTQTHYCRVEGKNKSVVSMMIETQGVPFSDAFNLQLRWVATQGAAGSQQQQQQQQQDLHVQVGLSVVFTKQVIVASKIRAGVKKETTKTQVDLFRSMKKECSGEVERDRDISPVIQMNRRKSSVDDLLLLAKDAPFNRLTGALVMCFPFLSKDNDHREVEEKNNVQDELDKVQQMLRTVRALPQRTHDNDAQRAYVLSKCNVVQEALNAIIVLERHLEESRAVAHRNRLVAQNSRSISNNNDHHPNHQQVPPALQAVSRLYEKMAGHVRAATPRNWLNANDEGPEQEEAAFDAGPDPEPDKVLKGMNVIVSKIIHNATVMDVYKLMAGGDDDGKGGSSSTRATASGAHQPSFYRSWLEATDRRNVEIEPWSEAPAGEMFVEDWSKETFEKRRAVTARVPKSKFMNGALPVLAKQSMEQFCRLQDHDRLVMASSTKVDHFAFANTFKVCIRWVVSRVGSCDVSVKIGMFVLFQKQTLLESKIRAGALKETQRLQLDLFRRIRDTINANGSTSTARRFSLDGKKLASSQALLHSRGGSIIPTSTHWFLPIEHFCIPKMQKMTKLYPVCMLEDDATLKHEFQQIQFQLQTVKSLLSTSKATSKEARSDDEEDRLLSAPMEDDEDDDENDKNQGLNFIQSELRVAYEALDNVVVWHGNAQDGPQILADASFAN